MCAQHASRLRALTRNKKENKTPEMKDQADVWKIIVRNTMSGCLMLLLFQASHRRRHRTLGKEKTMDTTCRHEKTSVHRWTAAESSPEPFLCSHPTTSNCPPIHPSPLKLSRLETYTQAQDLQPPPFSASKKAHAMNCIPGSIVVETTTGSDSLQTSPWAPFNESKPSGPLQ